MALPPAPGTGAGQPARRPSASGTAPTADRTSEDRPHRGPEHRDIVSAATTWFDANARPLPWRLAPTPWGVLVSEVMLQQTPVARVEPAWKAWLERWPTPADLSAEPAAEAIRAWGRLGYPRRALRLHEASGVIVERHGGHVPSTYEELRALPGVGDYTAAAVVSFAFRGRAVVLDVNVRRLLARVTEGIAAPAPHVTAAERLLAAELLPEGFPEAARWAAASMELGQVVCTARHPDCGSCPIEEACLWRVLGRPGEGERTTRPQGFEGTDRQVRGLIMARLREGPASAEDVDALWPDGRQLRRALDSLVADGLVDPVETDRFALPGD